MNAAVAMQNAVWLAIWPIKLFGLYDALITYTRISIPPFATRNTVHCLRQFPALLAVWKTEGKGLEGPNTCT